MPVNYKDIALKLFWTLVVAGLGFLLPALTDLPYWWAAPAIAVAQIALSYARQKTGATPPDIQGMPADVELVAVPK
jgi:hypothetical protein